jgi:hypothetical protein
MSYYTPSTRIIERSRPVPDSTRILVCPSCGDTMKHLRTISKLGVRPEKLIFVCPSCKEVETRELISKPHEAASKLPNHHLPKS